MKWVISIIVVASCNGCAFATVSASKFTVHVTDMETKSPVSNAVVKTIFEHKYDPWGNKPNKVDRRKESVDENGLVVFEGEDLGGSIGASVFADGYYSDWGGFEYKSKNLVLNRWKPWNPTIEVKMRPNKNPVPMVHKFQSWVVVPEFGKPVGYDLEVGDWMAPYGKGKINDFLFEMNLDRKSMAEAEASYTLTFSNPLDGIQEYLPPDDLRSSFIFPYVAPTNGYSKSLYQHDITTPYGPSKTTEKENVNYIFRVRTKTDEDGNIVSACYGRIRGELKISRKGQVGFSYWFNPDPQSRSLESDKQPY